MRLTVLLVVAIAIVASGAQRAFGGDESWSAYLDRALDRPCSIDVAAKPLDEVLRALELRTGAGLSVGSPDPSVPVTLKVRAIALRDVLHLLAIQTETTVRVECAQIVFATGRAADPVYEYASRLLLARSYSVRARALPPLPSPSAPQVSDQPADSRPCDEAPGITDADILVEWVRERTGGDPAWLDGTSLEEHRAQLLVTQTREGHALVAQALAEMREALRVEEGTSESGPLHTPGR
jgi:hypothetical protein